MKYEMMPTARMMKAKIKNPTKIGDLMVSLKLHSNILLFLFLFILDVDGLKFRRRIDFSKKKIQFLAVKNVSEVDLVLE